MLYENNTMLKIIVRIYEYLQIKATRVQPRMIKMDKPSHRSSVVSFMTNLPPSAGAQFVWDFLVFQFYIYTQQNHERRPLPTWFIGKESWVRWSETSDEYKWHAKQWAQERGLVNPVINNKYALIPKDVFEKEKLRMSRISGPNFCFAKFGQSAYDEDSDTCFLCPFKKDCEALITKLLTGETFYESVCDKQITEEESKHLYGRTVIVR